MAEPYFQFKQFRVYHHRDALKVGTDGVLLGAWTDAVDRARVLDIGTGTGLIALMVAQRSGAAVDAIDINAGAASLAAHNFANTPFADMRAHHSGLAEWLPGQREVYDLIVCNPPFFTHAQPPKDDTLHLAKHTVSLDPASLFREAARLLRPDGSLDIIIPTQGKEGFLREAGRNGLHITRQTLVMPLPDRTAKRLLLSFGHRPSETVTDSLVIEKEAGERGYTDQFKLLTRDFFIRF